MTRKMVHFLLAYDHGKGKLVRTSEFSDPNEAAEAYAEAERNFREQPQVEIVLVGADSIDTIHVTHGHYFAESPLVSKYLTLAG